MAKEIEIKKSKKIYVPFYRHTHRERDIDRETLGESKHLKLARKSMCIIFQCIGFLLGFVVVLFGGGLFVLRQVSL